MEDSILKLITIGYALGIAIVGVMAYLGIKGTNEAIDYQNSRLRQHDEWRKKWVNMYGVMVQIVTPITQLIGCEVARATRS